MHYVDPTELGERAAAAEVSAGMEIDRFIILADDR